MRLHWCIATITFVLPITRLTWSRTSWSRHPCVCWHLAGCEVVAHSGSILHCQTEDMPLSGHCCIFSGRLAGAPRLKAQHTSSAPRSPLYGRRCWPEMWVSLGHLPGSPPHSHASKCHACHTSQLVSHGRPLAETLWPNPWKLGLSFGTGSAGCAAWPSVGCSSAGEPSTLRFPSPLLAGHVSARPACQEAASQWGCGCAQL